MDCTRARTRLWPPERPRLVGGDVAAARAHVRVCENCTAYFAQDRALLDLYDRARRTAAPLPVREHVFDALARARSSTVRSRSEGEQARSPTSFGASADEGDARAGVESNAARRRLAGGRSGRPSAVAAAVAAIVVTMAHSRPVAHAAAEGPDMFVQDYLRRAVGEDHIETDDPAEVTRFLQRELGLRLEPLRLSGLALTRVEICLLEGRRGAMITYEFEGAAVSHYIVPREGARVRPPALSQHPSGDNTAGMPVVTWATPRIEQALVGEVVAEQLLQIALRGSLD